MRRSSEPEERAQFTVAELLARYGEPAPATGRRRRRAADNDTGIAAQPVAQPFAQTVAQPVRPDRDEPSVRSSGSLPTPDLPLHGPSQIHGSPRIESTQPGRSRRAWSPAVSSSSVVARRAPLTRPAAPGRPVTDPPPRLDPLPMNPAPWSSRRPIGTPTTSTPTTSAEPRSAQPPAGLGAATRSISEQNGNLTAERETKHEESGSPLWEWAAMVSQIGMGVVGGAALWLVCEWLWQRIPVVALVVALGVITGLVWIVRRVRRAEDLQTTVVAVLVGLFVTVSPAALLLVGR
jgi:hypothetical protein